ncbi:golgin subfamily B member 1-like [Mercenaria mercenaria]|uniref:golgin subfamily B member 1-like n=1 Tax=Mercenaria mercenaria TaxID=6596 RepID=UPI00234F1C7B|nr:golgin subfamily B member 1-like [Mercenaria mercenaria]
MSEEEQQKPNVCEHFEPQAWRKTVCKNCFQPPDLHPAGSGLNGVVDSSGSGKGDHSRSSSVEKAEKSAASSLKNKFEQLELDKFKPKEPAHTLPRTKKAGGLSLITEKYDELDRQAGKLDSPTKGIPPPTPPKTYKKSKDGTGLSKSKFGSLENVSSEDDTSDNKLGLKFKFGSMENIPLAHDKKKEPVPLPAQKSKFGGSAENITISFKTKGAESDSKDKKKNLANKLDAFQNEIKSGSMSKSGQTVIHQQKDGNVNIISLPGKSKPSDEKDNKKIDHKKDTVGKLNDKNQALSNKLLASDKEKQSDFKQTKNFLTSSKVNAEKSSDTKPEGEANGVKTDLKSGLKSVQKDKEDNKPVSDKLNKRDEKPDSKHNQDNKFKSLIDKNKDDLKKFDQKKQETPKPDDSKKPKLNFKDQLKSPETDSGSLSKFKDKLKSPTTEPDKKQAPSWKDKLKSSSSDNEKKTDLKSQLKSPTPDKEKESDFKLKLQLKPNTKEDYKTTDKLRDQLKSPISDKDKVPEFKLRSQLKSPTPDKEKEPGFKLRPQLKSPTPEKDKEPDFKLKAHMKSPTAEKVTDMKLKPFATSTKPEESNKTLKDQLKSPTPENDKKPDFKLKDKRKSPSPEKTLSKDLKSKSGSLVGKSEENDISKTKNKTLDFRSGLKKSNDTSSNEKDKEPPKLDAKNKFELPSLKSNKLNSTSAKSQDSKPKPGTVDIKGSEKISNKFEPKFKLNKTDSKTASSDEKDKIGTKKFELPKLKSSKSDQSDEQKSELKSKFQPKAKLNEIKAEPKTKFEIPSLKKVKSPEPEKTSVLKDNHSVKDSDKNASVPKKEDTEKIVDKKVSSKDTEDDFQKNKEKEESLKLESKEENESKKNTPNASDINKTDFDNVSSDTEAVSGDACAEERTRDKSPLHVDTQVFTSSRSKTAGVNSLNENKFDSTDNAPGISSIDTKRSESPPRDSSDKQKLQNGDIALEHHDLPHKKENMDAEYKSIKDRYTTSEIEKLKTELLIMNERCQNLEKENEILRDELHEKRTSESSLKKHREDVEHTIKGLRDHLDSMEGKCTRLETENINLMNDLKAKHENNQQKPSTKETEDIDERLTSREKIMEDMMEENEQLKQEINELKVEMEEMYDSFRDQEAEEFREIQKELEYTAKNCRILQFKLRKMERKNEQLEQDKNTFEEKLRKLQNSFQDRNAVSHIHSLEDELRMAKEVSVRLHDELDLMEDRRSKVEEENRHITELLEQADRKQFRLELEVDKLRDKVLELRQELRTREGGPEGEEPRKVDMKMIGKQSSLEHEIAELKRELYDGKEREMDLKDQIQFVDADGKKLRKKVIDLEQENDNLSKQLKKMSRERASSNKNDSNESKTEAEVETKIQLELSEKELSVLKRNMASLDEENELLHREMFLLEKRLKEQDRQLRIIPEPSSPRVYYEDKIKEFEKEANDFRSKLLDKEKEIENLYAQIQTMQVRSTCGKNLTKSKSLDLDTESDYSVVVDLKRQLEISHQENEALRQRILNLKDDKSALVDEIRALEERRLSGRQGLSTLAVAYIENEDETKAKTKLQLMEVSQQLLTERIQSLAKQMLSITEAHLPKMHLEQILKIAKISSADELIESSSDTAKDNAPFARVEKPSETNSSSGNVCELNTFTCTEKLGNSGSNSYSPSDEKVCDDERQQTIFESRDPDRLLSVIEEIYSVLIERLCNVQMDSNREVVPRPEKELNGHSDSPEMEISSADYSESVQLENKVSESGEESEIIAEKEMLESATSAESGNMKQDSICEKALDVPLEDDNNKEQSEKNPTENKVAVPGIDETANKRFMDRIAFLEEEIDDLRLIINTKEEKNVLLDEEVQELGNYIKKVQDDSRRREMELLSEMDLIHGKNEILNNLLEIVKDRAEAAEDELERLITEINENQDSSVSSEKSVGSSAPSPVSTGSDDVFDGSPAEKTQIAAFWEEQFKKRIRSLETLLAEERKKSSSLEKKLEFTGSDVISSAMSDDAKLHMREKELLQSELQESQKHAVLANDQIRSLTEKLKKVETEKWRSPKLSRKPQDSSSSEDGSSDGKQGSYCRTCAELQSVKDQLCDELIKFKSKAEELEVKIEEINEIWISKSAASEREKQSLEQKLTQRTHDCKRLDEQINKLREEDRMKDIFMKERDNGLKEKSAQIARKEELIQEQEEIIRQREEDLQSLFDQISQREKTIKELTESLRIREEQLKEKDNLLQQLSSNIEEKSEELHYLEEEVHEAVLQRKQSETKIAELQNKIEETLKGEKSELETENERLQSDIENLMGNITELHTDKVTLQNELDKAKHALSEAMLMWERDRSSLGTELSIVREKMRLMQETAEKKESQALQLLRKEVHAILETREKLAHELRLNKMEHENTVRILKTEKYKLTDELTSKIRMLTHEMNNNDKMSDELTKLRGQDDINYQLHHHEKILRAEYMAMKVRYETQLDRLQKEHLQLLEVVERLQRAKNLDQEIIVGIQKGMANIRETYSHDLSRWKDERSVLESHITQIEEGKEIAQHLRAQIDALKRQLSEQEMERSDLVNKMTTERRNWDIEKAQLISKQNQLEEQLAVFIQAQSKSKDVQYNMEVSWEKERKEQKRLLNEAHHLAMDLQEQLSRRDEENTREKKNLLDQLEKQRKEYGEQKLSSDKMALEVNTSETKLKHVEKQIEELKEKQKKEQDFWMKEKGDLLRRLAEMRKLHLRDVHRIDDVLAALKRLRELAAIVIESDHSAMLPSNGNDVSGTSGDASAASASIHAGENEGEMADLKQNIDQVILKYVKESLRQIHFLAEELARPSTDITREEKQKLRRSLSSSEIELLKDEFLLGPQEPGSRIISHHETIPEVKSQDISQELPVIHRQITHDGTINSDHGKPDYIENILMEQSSFFNDDKDSRIEVHRVKTTRDVTRVETKVTSLPKPPPSFIIPRSRSTSPAPTTLSKTKQTKPVLKSMSLESSHSHRLSAPVNGVSSRSSSADSSPVGTYSFIPSQNGYGLYGNGLQTGSLDRLSPNTARKKFFESQPSTSASFMSWPERRKRELNPNRNSRSLTGSTELFISENGDEINGNGRLRNSVSMDDGAINIQSSANSVVDSKRSRSAENTSKHSGLRDMFNAMKKRLKPKIKRSQSAREHDKVHRLQAVKETENVEKSACAPDSSEKEVAESKEVSAGQEISHVTQEQLTPILIPDDNETAQKK